MDVAFGAAKHLFVFSAAGKPIYTNMGDENDAAGLMAAARAIMAVAQSKGQPLKYVRSGRLVLAFLDRSPVCLVAASALAEPPAVLQKQLALVHGQIVMLLTASALESMFARNPAFDARRLLSGLGSMLNPLIESFALQPAVLLGAYQSLPLAPAARAAAAAALQVAVQAAGAVFGVLACADRVVALGAAAGQALQVWDALLLLNFVQSNEAFLHGEAFTPVCLPGYNAAGNVHAYIHCLDLPSRAMLVLLAAGAPDFAALSAARTAALRELEADGALLAIIHAAGRYPASLHAPSLPGGYTGVLHFAFKGIAGQQYVMSPFEGACAGRREQEALMVAYSQLRASMFDSAQEKLSGPLQRLRYEARPQFSVLASLGPAWELFVAFDALATKAEAFDIYNGLAGWLAGRLDVLFG